MTSHRGPVGPRVQGWEIVDQALALAAILAGRGEAGTVSPSSLEELFVDLGLPLPSKASNVLAALERRGDMTRGRVRGQWQLTPNGRQRFTDLMTEIDVAALLAEAHAAAVPNLGKAEHSVIAPTFAPPGLVEPLGRFLASHPFERNVFGMTRFPDDDGDGLPDPVQPALETARDVCAAHGLEFHLAADRAMDDDLWTNVAAHMWASRYGIAFFEDRRGSGVNYNLTIEVGSMLMAGRRCALLKDRTIGRLPTDLVGRIYKSIDLDSTATVERALHAWVRNDLGLGACESC